MNVTKPVLPPGAVKLRLPGPTVAAKAIDKLTVRDVGLMTETSPTVIPAPLAETVVAPETKFAPVIVRVTVDPAAAAGGSINVSAGLGKYVSARE